MGPLAGTLLAVVAIQDVTVIDPAHRLVFSTATVVTRDGMIAEVQYNPPVKRPRIPKGARVINGKRQIPHSRLVG